MTRKKFYAKKLAGDSGIQFGKCFFASHNEVFISHPFIVQKYFFVDGIEPATTLWFGGILNHYAIASVFVKKTNARYQILHPLLFFSFFFGTPGEYFIHNATNHDCVRLIYAILGQK